MFSMSALQTDASHSSQGERYVDDCVVRLRALFPNEAGTDPALKARVLGVIADLRTLGLQEPGITAYAVELVFRYHYQSGGVPMPVATVALLRDPKLTIGMRLDVLEQLVGFGTDDFSEPTTNIGPLP